LTRARQQQWLDSFERERFTDNTLIDQEALLDELEKIAELGYSTDNEEYIEGMVALAVAVKDGNDRMYATISFHGPCMRVPYSSLTDYLPAVQTASTDLSAIIEKLP